ncbi:MAG: amidohydrolase, partial [Bacteroidales bacterium]|nr:amidohydrolase [Bacteroidales bacterium]
SKVNKYDIHIRNARVLCLDENFTEFSDASILIRDGRIADIREDTATIKVEAKVTIDGSRKLIIPPFFNAHSHVAMSLLRGYSNDVPLQTWLEEYIWPAEKRIITPDSVYLGSMISGLEMIRSGCNIFADMYFFEDEVARASEELGIRAILGEGILDFPTPNMQTPAEGLRYTKRLWKKYHDHELISLSLPAHAPYTCSFDVLKDIAALSAELNIPATIHLSETKAEVEESLSKYRMTPTEYVENTGFFENHSVCYHCNHLSDNDISIFKKNDVSVITLPNSNMLLASGIAPIVKLMSKDINIGIGTDGAASNNNQSVLKDLQLLIKLQKVMHFDPTAISARQALVIATLNGAKAYGLNHSLGSLEIGKVADMILIDTDQPHMQPLYDPYAQILYSMNESDVSTLIINGRIIMNNRCIESVDEEKFLKEARMFSKKLQ